MQLLTVGSRPIRSIRLSRLCEPWTTSYPARRPLTCPGTTCRDFVPRAQDRSTQLLAPRTTRHVPGQTAPARSTLFLGPGTKRLEPGQKWPERLARSLAPRTTYHAPAQTAPAHLQLQRHYRPGSE